MTTLPRLALLLASVSALSTSLPSTAQAQAAASAAAAPVNTLVRQVAIPNKVFKLRNGLTVVVHEDRKAPVVGVAVWYNVGSKDEPGGKTGFAHLFEHLMFNGSENLPGDFFEYLQQIGATDYNGTTNFDRTNYFQTVPKGALERTLFMESDRMGYLLGAVTQAKLDNQRGVVQNEKRQGDNRPGGLVFYEVLENVFPTGHPYHHNVIGSMADLDSASLADVQKWFTDNYGPNNAVLVLAGDIDVAEARPLVEKYFGAIDRGPVNTPATAVVPTLKPSPVYVMKDRVAATQVMRFWPAPGILDGDLAAMDIGGYILGGLASSRLDNILVRDEKLAVSVSAGHNPFHRVGLFSVQATVKPGVDPAVVERRIDEILADYIRTGPTPAEVKRAATTEVAGRIRGLEQVGGFGGKAVTLAEGQTFAGDPNFYRRTLNSYAAVSPAQVRAATAKYLSRPAFRMRLEPGERPAYEEAKGAPKAAAAASSPPPSTKREIPPLATLAELDFPTIQRAQLSNGVRVNYAQRTAVPITQMAMLFDAGSAADSPNQRGLQSMALSLLDEGAGGLTSQQIAERQEELGASISADGSADRSTLFLSALSPNLAPSLDLFERVVEQPAFAPAEVERVRTQLLTGIAQAQKDPNGIATRALPALLYGANHPYAAPPGGDPAAVQRFTRDDLVGFQQRWLRPDNAELFIVSNLPLDQIMPQLEQRFGSWRAPAVAKGTKSYSAPPARPAAARVVLIDRPGSPQSVILGGQLTPVDPRSDIVPVSSASEVLGGNFLSRINMDLRETKGWSYGVRSSFNLNQNSAPYIVNAPVQADRTGDSIAALNQQIGDFLGAKGITNDELTRLVANNVSALPGRFETAQAVLGAMISNSLFGRPDDYQEQLAVKYRGLNQAGIDQALRGAVSPNGFVWVVVGDAKTVKPQLDKLGFPVEVAQPN
ncbi:MAG TPA: pitrilysin family protein [Sphingomicrobium sp.]|nr:pitrilysin family protein [Sphingomicrobium sp.]